MAPMRPRGAKRTASAADDRGPGQFAAGGTVIRGTGPNGQTLHGDHARVFFQVPVNARKLPLVRWHCFGQFGKTWETTADGEDNWRVR